MNLHLFHLVALLIELVLLFLLKLLDVGRGRLVAHRNHSFAHENFERAILAQGLIDGGGGIDQVLQLLLQLRDVLLHVCELHVNLAECVDFLLVLSIHVSVVLAEFDASGAHRADLSTHFFIDKILIL